MEAFNCLKHNYSASNELLILERERLPMALIILALSLICSVTSLLSKVLKQYTVCLYCEYMGGRKPRKESK